MSDTARRSITILMADDDEDDRVLTADALKFCPKETPLCAGFRLRQDRVLPFLRNAVKETLHNPQLIADGEKSQRYIDFHDNPQIRVDPGKRLPVFRDKRSS